jgi:hypothetical protein
MKDFTSTKARYLRDALPVRLGGLAADLARIGSTAVNPANGRVVEVLLEEARRFIEWTAEELDADSAGELIDLQLALTLWLHAWQNARIHTVERALLAHQAVCWSDRVLALSGLIASDPYARAVSGRITEPAGGTEAPEGDAP